MSFQQGTPVPAGPTPPNLHAVQIRLTPPVVYDEAPSGYAFGDVLAQPYPLADAGETIIAKFVSLRDFSSFDKILVHLKLLTCFVLPGLISAIQSFQNIPLKLNEFKLSL